MSNKKAKTKINGNLIKNVIFFVSVIIICVVYYYVSPFFLSEKHSSIDQFPLKLYGTIQNDLEIHFIDVGQGDAVLIKTPDGRNIMIDAGVDDGAVTEKVINYLKDNGVKTIDYLIATHPDADHIGGFPAIFDKFKVKFVFRPYVKSDNFKTDRLKDRFNPPDANYSATDIYADFVNSVKDERAEWVFINRDTDLSIDYGNGDVLTLDFLTPSKSLSELKYYDLNDYSPLLKLSYANFSVMFTGDATKSVEEEALAIYSERILDCDLLKVAHHGSKTSSSYDFIKAVSPNYAVISCGLNNDYGHPDIEVTAVLLNFAIKTYRTDKQGSIIFKINHSGECNITCTQNQ